MLHCMIAWVCVLWRVLLCGLCLLLHSIIMVLYSLEALLELQSNRGIIHIKGVTIGIIILNKFAVNDWIFSAAVAGDVPVWQRFLVFGDWSVLGVLLFAGTAANALPNRVSVGWYHTKSVSSNSYILAATFTSNLVVANFCDKK